MALVPPEDEVAGYMDRMDFFDLLRGVIAPTRGLSHLGARGRHPVSLCELRRVEDLGDVTHVVWRFSNILSEGALRDAEVRYCCDVPSESLMNVLEHAESP